ncbi:TonB-dependent receptor [Mangrovivirga sp. M17]|uniref:TonB-dependent receptor n=1 Tax=Mangrovivirga halotolerans TaxID=2993936 RepID=A0ABT3RQN3_9BACT|nr:TonB-dependent receptor [Mangrovivirga halotolerans]MCX2744101.1 TonB-dependent receptor [Mangrovivirga halotolerans]
MIKKVGYIFLVWFFAFDAYAQEADQKILLEEILFNVEKKHDVSFTYIDENVRGIRLLKPSDNLSLKETLDYLELNTDLKFKILNDRFIAITKIKSSKSQEICGYVKDFFSKDGVENVLVRSGGNYVVTNENGFFEIAGISRDSLITFSLMGYETARKKTSLLMQVDCPDVFIRPTVISLPEIVISNYLTVGINKKADGSFVVDTEELGTLPGLIDPDVLQIAQALPGVQSIDESVSDINVRGGTNDQNLVRWNGIRMYQTGHFFGLISAFNPYLTDKITIIKNGTSAFYGSGVSSTILIESEDEITEEFSGAAGINMISADMYLKIPLTTNSSIQVSSRRSTTDLIATPTYNEYFNRVFLNTEITDPANQVNTVLASNENFYFYDISARYLHDFENRDKLRISFLTVYNDLEYLENAVVNNNIESRTSTLQQQNIAAGIAFSHFWSDKVKTNTNLYLSSYNLSSLNFDILKEQRLDQGNEVLDLGLSINTQWLVSDLIDFSAGYQLNEIGITNYDEINNPSFSRSVKEVGLIHSVFLEGYYVSSNDKTFVITGLRMNHYNKVNQLTIEPRLSINQKISNYFSLEILGEIKSQTTAQVIDFENDFLGVEKRRWILSNGEDVPLATSKQGSVGFNYNKKGFLINLEAYHKFVEGITSSSQGFQNQFQFIREEGQYTSAGFDVLVNKKFGGKFNSWLSYSYSENTYKFNEFVPSEFPSNLDIRHIFKFGSSYATERFEASIGLNWRTGKPYTPALLALDQLRIIYGEPNSLYLGNYFRVDASLKYNFEVNKRVKGELGTSFWNITNNKNILNTYYRVNSEDELQLVEEFALGFTPNVMLRLSF